MRPTNRKYCIFASVIIIVYLVFSRIHKILQFKSSTLTVRLGKETSLQIFFREYVPFSWNLTVVFLHGQAFDSGTWKNLHTLDIIKKAGFRAIAVDLPGHGSSYGPTLGPSFSERGFTLRDILLQLHATDCILVAPSMSGTYALPVVVRGRLPLKGFVAIAPVGTNQYTEVEYASLRIPTLIMYGSEDSNLGLKSLLQLQHIPNSRVSKIPRAGHACYTQNPRAFHRSLIDFIQKIKYGVTNK